MESKNNIRAMILYILLGAVIGFTVLFILFYLTGYLYISELNHPNLDWDKFRSDDDELNVLVVYPHPDDEVLISGGAIYQLANMVDVQLYTVSVTNGQAGNELLPEKSPAEIGQIRAQEYATAMSRLGVENYQVWNFTDARTDSEEAEIKAQLLQFVADHNINLIITYEKHGAYAHPDHVVVSKVVHEVTNSNEKVNALYSTASNRMYDISSLPKEITVYGETVVIDEDFQPHPPQYKLLVFSALPAKYEAAKVYESQELSGDFPLWFLTSATGVEYYTEKY